MPLPDAIAGAPRLRPGLDVYWDAFQRLTTCRAPAGMGPPGQIPWTAVDHYAMRHGFEGDAYDDLMDLVFAMDEAYVEHLCEEFKKATDG